MALGKHLGVLLGRRVFTFPMGTRLLTCPPFPTTALERHPTRIDSHTAIRDRYGLRSSDDGTGLSVCWNGDYLAIVLGISSSIGSLVPLLVFAPDQVLRPQGISVMAGIVIGLIGTGLVAWAAWERDAAKANTGIVVQSETLTSTRNLVTGLGLAIASGLLSSCGNLGFAFANQISQRSRETGAESIGAASATWAVILIPVFLCNFIYSLYLLRKNKSAHLFRQAGTAHYWGWGILMGVDWIAGMTAYGAGALRWKKWGHQWAGSCSSLS